MSELRDDEGEGVVSAAGNPLPHDQSHADADKARAEYGGQKRMIAQVGQTEGEDFPEPQEKGQGKGGCDGTGEEGLPQIFKARRIA